MHRLETLLEATVDKNFDKVELYMLRYILTVPDGLEGWVKLAHYEVSRDGFPHSDVSWRRWARIRSELAPGGEKLSWILSWLFPANVLPAQSLLPSCSHLPRISHLICSEATLQLTSLKPESNPPPPTKRPDTQLHRLAPRLPARIPHAQPLS